MIVNVCELKLPLDETLIIKKNRLEPAGGSNDSKRLCVVSGTHGDELEGQYVCWNLISRINAQKSNLTGTVDVYPAINPLGIDTATRFLPVTKVDMNRIFPVHGNDRASERTYWHAAEYIASCILEDIQGADMCVDIHSSDIYLKEIPQVRLTDENSVALLPYAKLLNTDFVWIAESNAVRRTSLAYGLNSAGVPALVVEAGVGCRITKEYGDRITDGIFALMAELGIWAGSVPAVSNPIVSNGGAVTAIRSNKSGVFVPAAEHWAGIMRGDSLGEVLNPFTGEVEEELFSPVSGAIFTLREYPVVTPGELIARILGEQV